MKEDIVNLWDFPDILLAVWEYIQYYNLQGLPNGKLRYIATTETFRQHYPHLTKPFYIGEYATMGKFCILADKPEHVKASYCESHIIDLEMGTMTIYSEYALL